MTTTTQVRQDKTEPGRRHVFIPMVCRESEGGKPAGSNIQSTIRTLGEDGLSFRSKTIYSAGSLLHSEIYLPVQKEPISPTLKVERVVTIAGTETYIIHTMFSAISAAEKKLVKECLDELDLYKILARAKKDDVSDIHLTVGHPALFRKFGKLSYMDSPPIEDGQIKAMLYPLLDDSQIEYFEKNKELDFAFSPSLDSRYRVNMHVQKGFVESALRSINTKVSTFEELLLPAEQLRKFCQERAGLVLISGKTGAGKSTTLTSMIDYVNHHMENVIVAIEDPVEYIHQSDKSIIKQRELGHDTKSYAEALRHSLRQDPDIIIVSELLDAESVLAAMRAAETGHLVISTIHAPDTAQTIERILNLFPPEHATSVCQQLSSVLLGIMFQMLLPNKKGGLVAATELLVNTSAIRTSIREGRFSQIGFSIQTGSASGMYTLESSLTRLKNEGLVDDQTIQENTRSV